MVNLFGKEITFDLPPSPGAKKPEHSMRCEMEGVIPEESESPVIIAEVPRQSSDPSSRRTPATTMNSSKPVTPGPSKTDDRSHPPSISILEPDAPMALKGRRKSVHGVSGVLREQSTKSTLSAPATPSAGSLRTSPIPIPDEREAHAHFPASRLQGPQRGSVLAPRSRPAQRQEPGDRIAGTKTTLPTPVPARSEPSSAEMEIEDEIFETPEYDFDVALFREATELYLQGNFLVAETLYRKAGGKLGQFFVERCEACAQSNTPWPGYFSWEAK